MLFSICTLIVCYRHRVYFHFPFDINFHPKKSKMPVISSCVVCKYRFTYVDCPVKCDGCSQLVHRKCSNLSAEELKCFNLKNRLLKFFCESCVHGSSQDRAETGRLNSEKSVNNIGIGNSWKSSEHINEVSWKFESFEVVNLFQ